MAIDISPTMLTLASFMARFDDSESFRLKIKFCVMCENVCDRTDTLTLRKDSWARHRILDMVIDWMQPISVRACSDYNVIFTLMLLSGPRWGRSSDSSRTEHGMLAHFREAFGSSTTSSGGCVKHRG